MSTWYYTPQNLPLDAPGWMKRELLEISRASYGAAPFVQYEELHAEPAKPRTGMTVLADGTDWDPGSGAGFYGYYGSAWVKLG